MIITMMIVMIILITLTTTTTMMMMTMMTMMTMTMMTMMMMMMMMIMMIKRPKSRFLRSPHCAAKCLQYGHSSGLGVTVYKSDAIHRALLTCNMCAAWREGTVRL